MQGGLDLVTAPLQRSSGVARTAQNFEVEAGAAGAPPAGYRRTAGYERFDGRAKPSAASYVILAANISGVAALGGTLVGATSGATGIIIALPTGQFVLTKVTGTFLSGENLTFGGPVIAVATASPTTNSSTGQLHARYKNLAADQYRANIAAVPGSGNVLGAWLFQDITYAFRNNAGGTATDMYKSTAAGWVKVNFEFEVTYTVGSGSVDDGDVLTQGGVTATVRRVLVRTGTLAGASAVGTLVISAPAGGNFVAGAATTTGGGTLTLGGVQTAITLSPGGRFEFVNENFGASSITKRMYGCDGVNRAFEFDGSFFVPIPTGMTADTPAFIAAHKKHLILAYGSSAQISSDGSPYGWSPLTGAAELGMGDTISGFGHLPGDATTAALAIYTRNRISVLYGSGTSTWSLIPYREELGAVPYTIQDVGFPMYLDDRGISDMRAVQAFGNFTSASVSDAIRTLITSLRGLATASVISRDRNQYRLFFSDRSAIYVTVQRGKILGLMPMLFDHRVVAASSGEMTDGSEAMFFGSDDGFVYQMEKGTSFDGGKINWSLELAYNFCGTPRINKKFHDAMLELSGGGYAEFTFGYSLGYGSSNTVQPPDQAITTNFSTVQWDAFVWDSFTWDGSTLLPGILKMGNEAENYSLAIRGSSDEFEPFTVSGAVVQYAKRRRLRA